MVKKLKLQERRPVIPYWRNLDPTQVLIKKSGFLTKFDANVPGDRQIGQRRH
jgi:hypothetical protein